MKNYLTGREIERAQLNPGFLFCRYGLNNLSGPYAGNKLFFFFEKHAAHKLNQAELGQNGPLASIVEIFGPIALFAK